MATMAAANYRDQVSGGRGDADPEVTARSTSRHVAEPKGRLSTLRAKVISATLPPQCPAS